MKKVISIAMMVFMISTAFAHENGKEGNNRFNNRSDDRNGYDRDRMEHRGGYDGDRNDRDHNDRDRDHHYIVEPVIRNQVYVDHVVMRPQYEQCFPVAMNPNQFCQLKDAIDRAWFEEGKIAIFKQALAYNYFTAAQVLDLMNQFGFESSKLQVAEMAYAKTVDRNNYYIVDNGFSFSSSIDELGQYTAMR